MPPFWKQCKLLTPRAPHSPGPARRPLRSLPFLLPQKVKLLAGTSHLRRGPVAIARTSLSSFRRTRHRLLPFQDRSGLRKRAAHFSPPPRKISLPSLSSLRGDCSCQGTHLRRLARGSTRRPLMPAPDRLWSLTHEVRLLIRMVTIR